MNENETIDQDFEQKTLDHITSVNRIGSLFEQALICRLVRHDESKIQEPEKTMFAKHTKKLENLKYGTKEYNDQLEEMKKDCLNHHYENNSHHPEHYKNGVNDMDLLDIIEMMCDWKASCERTKDGNFEDSLEINMNRFHIEEPLKGIITRSSKYLYNYYIEVYHKGIKILEKGFDLSLNSEILVYKNIQQFLEENNVDRDNPDYTIKMFDNTPIRFKQILENRMRAFHDIKN